jgi:hypothetical protein
LVCGAHQLLDAQRSGEIHPSPSEELTWLQRTLECERQLGKWDELHVVLENITDGALSE